MSFLKLIILVCTLCILTACPAKRVQWTDEVLLHDGRIIHVARTATMGSRVALIHLPDSNSLHNTAVIYGLKTQNPNTSETVSWHSSDQFVLPVLLDFDGTSTYLVIHLPNYNDVKTQYGCTWPPYVFLRHERDKNWERIPATEAPSFLRFANLSRVYNGYDMTRKPPIEILQGAERERVLKLSEEERVGFQTIERIRNENIVEERRKYDFQVEIPRTASDWKFKPQSSSCQ